MTMELKPITVLLPINILEKLNDKAQKTGIQRAVLARSIIIKSFEINSTDLDEKLFNQTNCKKCGGHMMPIDRGTTYKCLKCEDVVEI